jgi:hypothetical protein
MALIVEPFGWLSLVDFTVFVGVAVAQISGWS